MKPSILRQKAFILRMWLESGNRITDQAAWRCVLVDLQHEQRIGFSTTEALFDYLTEQISKQQLDVQDES